MRLAAVATRCASWVLLALAGPLAAQAGVPLGAEFRVNTYTSGDQRYLSVASDSSGRFVVVWTSPQDGSGDGIFGQRYASSGAPAGTEFRVNTYTTDRQWLPSVASASSGNFVVVWESQRRDSGYDVFGQRYASSGLPAGAEFRVNSYTTYSQRFACVASASSGNFVVVWQDVVQDGSGYGVFGQRYASSGAPVGGEFRVNTYTTDNQSYPRVASDSSGNFVVVWASRSQDGSLFGVFGQRYASSGAPAGGEFRVNSFTTDSQWYPSVASDGSGNFVVAWQSNGVQPGGNSSEIFAQRYVSSGAPTGSEFRVNTYTTYAQSYPSVASDSSGNFVVVWNGVGQDGSLFGILGQRYASSGSPAGPEFQVNTYTTYGQYRPGVASDALGNFVVLWMSVAQDASDSIFGQRYGKIVPVELIRFTVE